MNPLFDLQSLTTTLFPILQSFDFVDVLTLTKPFSTVFYINYIVYEIRKYLLNLESSKDMELDERIFDFVFGKWDKLTYLSYVLFYKTMFLLMTFKLQNTKMAVIVSFMFALAYYQLVDIPKVYKLNRKETNILYFSTIALFAYFYTVAI